MIGHTCGDYIVRAGHIGFDCLHGIKLAGGYLLQGSGMKYIVHATERIQNGIVVPHIAYVEFDFLCVLRI